MANIRYNVTCPSCEATVTIRSAAAIGKKAECPKCKYRFTVPEPDDEDGDENEGKKTKKKEKAGGSKTMLFVGLGAVAVLALAGVGFFVIGGGDDGAKPAGGGGGAVAQSGSTTPMPGSEGAMDDPMGMGDPMNAAGPLGMGDPSAPPPPKKETKKAAPKRPGNLKDPTNLLPGDTVAVLRVNPDRLDRDATPVSTALLDGFIRDLFHKSLGFETDQLGTYIHAVAGPTHDPFVVLQAKQSFNPADIYAKPGLEKAAGSPIKGREFYVMKSNPLVNAVSKAFGTAAMAEMAGVKLPAALTPAPGVYTLCVYDANTLLISTEPTMAKFLGELKADGYPPFKTDLTPAAPPPPPRPAEGGMGEEGMPPEGMPPGALGGPPPGIGSSGGPPPGAIGSSGGPPPMGMPPGGPGQPAPATPSQVYTSIPTYRTLNPTLKRLLNRLEEDENDPPAAIYATLINQQAVNLALATTAAGSGSLGLDTLTQIRMLGATLKQLGREKGEAIVTVEYASDDAAKKSVTDQLMPLLALAKPKIDELFGTQTQITTGQAQGPGQGYPGFPGGEGGFPGGESGFPGGESGYPGGMPPGGYPGGPPPMASGPPGGSRSFPGGPPPGGPPPGSFPGGMPPGGFPGDMTGTGVYDPTSPNGPAFAPSVTASKITVSHTGSVVNVTAEINWKEDKYVSEVHTRIVRTASMLKGRVAVLAGGNDWHTLAAVAPPLAKTGTFPPGAFERPGDDRRFGLPYPPNQRVSFMADLLPYIGRGGLRRQVDERAGWHSKTNIDAAEAWVPEFLVPYYPQSAWRAQHALAEGRSLGGTNFVALAGVGLDAARYDPLNPDDAKKAGMTGYDWSSRPDDVKDGLSNTIYMIQTPPGDGRPWIAGGGSTLVGVDDKATDPLADFVHTTPDGKKGTYVLMGDGSVRWVKAGTDPKVFTAMVTRAGGESLANLDANTEKLRPALGRGTELATTTEKPTISTTTVTTPKGPGTAKGGTRVDANELKKFQGTWKATAVFLKGKTVAPEALGAMNIEMTFNGTVSTAKVAGNTEVVTIDSLDPTNKPARMTVTDRATKKSELSVYEFVTPNKVRMLSQPAGSTIPTAVTRPAEGTANVVYVELERAGK